MPFPSYMQGTPAELLDTVQKARLEQQKQGGPWSPALDALEAFAYQDPAYQNQAYADMAQSDATGPITPWQKYAAVTEARGVNMPWGGSPSTSALRGLASAYRPDQMDIDTDDLVDASRANRTRPGRPY